MNVLISACLLGVACRYDGASRPLEALTLSTAPCTFIPVCAEILGGLPTPRPPAERQGERVRCADGRDVTAAFVRGAREVLRLARWYHCRYALFKERSPSCGKGSVYDGRFSGTLIPGDGVTTALLEQHGIAVFGESQLAELLARLERPGA